ncbi:F0F1 ATP synthase subunit delta [Neisseria sp.]|uniref:F0F1 ATP synthase subunit delta n=1 Tax=Neisseria sp. TaxID=192066 RepID=UPI00359FA466
MAEFATIARPYAKALFGLAKEKNQIESWLGGLKALASVVQQEKVVTFIEQPERGAAEKAALLSDLVGLTEGGLKNFVLVLSEQKRLSILPAVYAQFQDLSLALSNTKPAVIYSAYELTQNQIAELVAVLKQRFGADLEVETAIDSALIGGVKVEVGDQVLDLSVRNKLTALYTAMTN